MRVTATSESERGKRKSKQSLYSVLFLLVMLSLVKAARIPTASLVGDGCLSRMTNRCAACPPVLRPTFGAP